MQRACALFTVFNEKDFVDDWGVVFQTQCHELVGNSGGDQVGMSRFTFKNDSKANYGRWFFVGQQKFSGEGDFKGTWDSDEVHASIGKDFRKLVDGGLDERVGELGVVLPQQQSRVGDGDSQEFEV